MNRCKFHKKYILLILLIIIEVWTLVTYTKPLFRELFHCHYSYTSMSDFSGRGYFAEDGIKIDEESADGYTGLFTFYPFFNLEKGSYRVTVTYDTTGDNSTALLSCNTYTGFHALKGDTVILSPNKQSITFNAYLSEKIIDVQVITNYSGQGELTIHSISVDQTRNMERKELFCALILIFSVNLILILKSKGVFKNLTTNDKNVLLALILLACAASIPLFINKLTNGADLRFHLLRIEGIKEGLLSGSFPVKIHPMQLEGYGYACGVFYGDLLLYFPAVLRIIGFDIQQSYKIFVFCINLATSCVTYFAINRIIKDRKISLLGTAMYLFAPYRLYGMYGGHTVGEYCALLFVPLVILGLYEIFTMDVKNPKYKYCFIIPTIGYSGLITCHVLTTEMVGVFTILVCILLIRRTFRLNTFLELLKTLVSSLLLCMGFIVPFMDYFFNDQFTVNSQQSSIWIQYWGLQLSQFFQVFPAYGSEWQKSFDGGTGLNHMKNTGVAVLLLTGVFLYLVFMLRKEIKQENKKKLPPMILMAGLGIMSLVMASIYFPWDNIRRWLYDYKLEVIVNSIQDSTRFMQIGIILLIIPGCYALKVLLNHDESRNFAKNVMMIAVMLVTIQTMSQTDFILNNTPEVTVYDLQQFTQRHTWSLEEYVPADTDLGYLTSIGLSPSENVEITNYQKDYLNISISVNNSSGQSGYVDLPLLYYRGYEAVDLTGNTASICKSSNNNVVRLDVPGNYSGDVNVYFKEPVAWRIAECVSLISVIAAAVYLIIQYNLVRRGKRNENKEIN